MFVAVWVRHTQENLNARGWDCQSNCFQRKHYLLFVFLLRHYRREFEKYTHQLNEGKTTRRVMFWATKYPGERINAKRIAQEIGESEETVRASLEKLRWADVVEKTGLISYQGPTDPMLRRYIEYHYATEIEELAPAEVLKNWKKQYDSLLGRMNSFTGEVAEV